MNIILFLILIMIIICLVFYKYYYDLCNNPIIHNFNSNVEGQNVIILGGTHGNEPAGSVYLDNLIKNLNNNDIKIKSGSLVIIPQVNPCGKCYNVRNVPNIVPFTSWDINRQYYQNSNSQPHLINQSALCLPDPAY